VLVLSSFLSPLGEIPGVGVAPLARPGRGAGGEGLSLRTGRQCGVAVEIPHPQPFSLREKGVNLSSVVLGVGVAPLARLGRGAGAEGIPPSPALWERGWG